jgi:hypothetical protein
MDDQNDDSMADLHGRFPKTTYLLGVSHGFQR